MESSFARTAGPLCRSLDDQKEAMLSDKGRTMNPTLLIVFGIAGQLCFFLRFLIQWAVSEKRKESVIPVSFWYLSLCGGLTLLAYAIYRSDPVFIIGQLGGTLVYCRNLMLISRSKKNPSVTA